MTAYAVAHLRNLKMGPGIVEYLQKIDATLEPFGGRFLVHGGDLEVIEGEWPGHLVVIEFESRERARAWYRSQAYQQILPLRTRNADGNAVLAQGVSSDYKATNVLG